MTAGALLQLVAYGSQDEYLTGNPQITFFKVVYKRHTNFAMESIQQSIVGNVSNNSKIYSKISRKGDLLYNCWLDIGLDLKSVIDVSINTSGHNYTSSISTLVKGNTYNIDVNYTGDANRINENPFLIFNTNNVIRYYVQVYGYEGNDTNMGDNVYYLSQYLVSGNVEKIDDNLTPIIDFIKGFTYEFEYIDSDDYSNHPLFLDYNSDSNDNLVMMNRNESQKLVTYIIPYDIDTNDTLEYYCSKHSGMGYADNTISDNTSYIYKSDDDSDTSDGSFSFTINTTDNISKLYYNGGSFDVIENTNDDIFHGLSLIEYIDINIGNQLIDRHYYRWIHTYMSSLVSSPYSVNYEALQYVGGTNKNQIIKIPFLFWFCRNPGLALPLIALQYHNVHFDIKFSNVISIKSATASSDVSINNAKLWCNYIYLDSDERRRFSQVSHEYLIEQVQYQKNNLNSNSSRNEVTSNIKLKFNHPVKYLIFYLGVNEISDDIGTNYSNNIYLTSAQMKMNGINRFEEISSNFFKHIQFLQSSIPNHYNNSYKKSFNYLDSITTNIQDNESLIDDCNGPLYYMYSFSLKPTSHQPSGTCNFSKIDLTELILKHKSTTTNTSVSTIHTMAVNYNVLRIECGLGGLAYSN